MENLDPESDAFLEKLLQGIGTSTGKDEASVKPSFNRICPTPGICLKTRDSSENKIFINLCTSDQIPEPKEITEEELEKVIEDPDNYPPFRIPMSIGEPHAETDKGGGGCTAYDIVFHPKCLERAQTMPIFQAFLFTILFEGLEHKYSIILNRNWVMLKNKKALGNLTDHLIRSSSKPVIMEVADSQQKPSKPLIQEVSDNRESAEQLRKRGETPEFTIIQAPPSGHPEFLVAEMKLPGVRTAQTLNLDLGEDRIVLASRSDVYYLDIYLPYNIIQTECGAQFNRNSQMLTITMPVQPCE